MNIKALRYFVEIANQRSFTGASKKLLLCQSALSKSIKTFEEELGITLIDRQSKGFALTLEGQLLHENGQLALSIIDEQLEEIEQTIKKDGGSIRLGIPAIINSIYFSRVIEGFLSEHPDISVDIINVETSLVKERVLNSDVDIGVLFLPSSSSEFNVTSVYSSEIVVLVHESHPLASRDDIRFEELGGEPLIILDETFPLHRRILTMCSRCAIEPNIICKCSTWDFILDMVDRNQGISILPRPILEPEKLTHIKVLPISEPKFPWNIALITKKNKYISKACKQLVEYARDMHIEV